MDKVTCDECQNDFNIYLQEYQYPVTQVKGYVIETYFMCPHCNKKYIAFVTDKQARKMQKEIRSYHNQIFKKDYTGLTEEEYKKEIDKQHNVLNIMKQELKIKMDNLKEQIKALN
ncbi:hypothetical protein J6TS2_33500 [Heyndrickxia sporothermodurans]|nr:hypothetical protein J6TS2_33500 [Heyndrickxia sporothermodurans]